MKSAHVSGGAHQPDNNLTIMASSQREEEPAATAKEDMLYVGCELPTETVGGVLKYFHEALSPDSRKKQLTNGPGLQRTPCTTITALKQPGKRAGVIFTRLSNERPNVAIVSMILHDSMFAPHNAEYGGKLEGSVVVAINDVPVDNARHAARLMIMAEGEVSLTVEMIPLESAVRVKEMKEHILAGGAITNVSQRIANSDVEITQAESTVKEDEIKTTKSSLQKSIEPTASVEVPSRVKSRTESFNPLDQNYSSLISTCDSVSEESHAPGSVNHRRMHLLKDHQTDTTSVCSDRSRLSRFLEIQRMHSLSSTYSNKSKGQEPINRKEATDNVEDEIMTPKKDNAHRKPTDRCNHPNEYYGLDNKQRQTDVFQTLNANGSSVTAATADLTYVPSFLSDDGSAKEADITYVQSSSNNDPCPSDYLKPTESRLKIDVTHHKDMSITDLPTPVLLQKLESLFSKNKNKSTSSLAEDCNSNGTQDTCTSTRADNVFGRIMDKYSQPPSSDMMPEAPNMFNRVTHNEIIEKDESSLSSQSRERDITNQYFSNLLRQQGAENGSTTLVSVKDDHQWGRDNKVEVAKSDARWEEPEPMEENVTKSDQLYLHQGLKMMQIELKESIDEDSDENYIAVEHKPDDDVSMLSRSTCLTIGSASFCSTDTREIQSHVKSIVRGIVTRELSKSGTITTELEAALESKAKLESRVRKLTRRNRKQDLQLKDANLKNEIIVEEIDKEITVHLTRKAAELKSCMDAALKQAEESKRRAVEVVKSSMEQEILNLRSELDSALEHGVYLDTSLQRALALVESNQQTLRLAAENDAQNAEKMKTEIESSFVCTVDELEKWADQQVTLMERLESSVSSSGGMKAADERRLKQLKSSLESAMSGMTRMEYRMRTRTQSGQYSGYV